MAVPTPLGPELDTVAAAEFAVLTTGPGQRLLGLVAPVGHPTPAEIARWRRLADPALVAAAIRITETRRNGAAKFTRSDQMWFSARGLEQATAEAVAQHKARRFAAGGEPGEVVVDLCSGIGADSVAIARSSGVVAIDLDPAMTARTLWNAGVHDVELRAITARAEDFPIPPDALLHIDPDRRVTSARKVNTVVDYVPGLGALLGWTRTARGGAIKLGPASDFATHFGGSECEVEVVSLRGECKEATVWFGDRVAPNGARRRATTLPTGATWTDRDHVSLDPARPLPVGKMDRYVFDPDPALVRAGLLNGFARAHGYRRIEAEVDLLTGPVASSSPFLTCFEVVEMFPLDLKILRRAVAVRNLGPLEIKTRGLSTRPEAYRAQLRPAGSNPATWILIGSRTSPGQAILARRG